MKVSHIPALWAFHRERASLLYCLQSPVQLARELLSAEVIDERVLQTVVAAELEGLTVQNALVLQAVSRGLAINSSLFVVFLNTLLKQPHCVAVAESLTDQYYLLGGIIV